MFVEHLDSFGNSVSGLGNTGIIVELEGDTLLMNIFDFPRKKKMC